MKTIKNTAGGTVSINRKDNGEAMTLAPDTEYTLDDETANYLLSLRDKDEGGNDVYLFVEVPT